MKYAKKDSKFIRELQKFIFFRVPGNVRGSECSFRQTQDFRTIFAWLAAAIS
jgi:hypothetical protein